MSIWFRRCCPKIRDICIDFVAHHAGAYLQSPQHETTRSISTPPWMGCWYITWVPPVLSVSVPIYTHGCRAQRTVRVKGLPKNTAQ